MIIDRYKRTLPLGGVSNYLHEVHLQHHHHLNFFLNAPVLECSNLPINYKCDNNLTRATFQKVVPMPQVPSYSRSPSPSHEQTQQNPPSPTSPMSSLSKMPTATVIFISSHLASSRVLVGCPKFHVIGPGGFHVAKDFTVGPGGLRVQPVVAVASVANFNPGPI